MNPNELERVSSEKNVAILSNAIADCMIGNSMPLEYLDRAYEDVKEIYRKNAVMPKSIKFFIWITDTGVHKCRRAIGKFANINLILKSWQVMAVLCMYFVISVFIRIIVKIVFFIQVDSPPF